MQAKSWCALSLLACVAFASCGSSTTTAPKPASHVVQDFDKSEVDVACGQCLFDMEGGGCVLAVRSGGESWFVDGVDADSLGDPHAANGMCNAVRKAVVSGHAADGRFAATTFELVADSN